MPSLTYPGVYTQEVAGAPAPIQGVSTSILALIGFTKKGPIDDPVLVTGFKEFERKFGSFISEGLVPTTLHSFFKNGGQLAYIVRVVGSGSAIANAYIGEAIAVGEALGSGDGTETSFTGTMANIPIEPGSLSITDGTETFTDTDGDGTFTGSLTGTGTIDYDTGAFSVTFNSAPTTGTDNVTASAYNQVLWELNIQWPGVKGNDYRLDLYGTPGYEADATATFTRWTLDILEETDGDGQFTVVERFEELDFTTATSSNFFPTVLNDDSNGSNIVTVVDVGNTGVPTGMSGTAYTTESLGNGDGSTKQFTGTLTNVPVHETTITITDGNDVITDDGEGNLIGDVDATGTNTINYTTGAYDVTFASAPTTGTDNVTADYYEAATYDEASPYQDDFTGGLDGSAVTSTEVNGAALEAQERGLFALNKVDDLMMVGIPDFAGDETVDAATLDYCSARMDRFAILATPSGMTVQQAVNHKRRDLNKNSNSYGAIYYPWVKILDPVTEKSLDFPPIGHVAGRYAATDAAKSVGKAPAGVQDGQLSFILGMEASLTAADVGVLNQNRVNAIVDWPHSGGNAIWGARTLEVGGEYGYIQARRLFMFLEKSIFNATHIYVFENNGPELWARIRLQLQGFLFRLYTQGYFAGDSPDEAFFVVVDETNNPQEVIDAGELHISVGAAPNKPAEFLVFTFQQKLPG